MALLAFSVASPYAVPRDPAPMTRIRGGLVKVALGTGLRKASSADPAPGGEWLEWLAPLGMAEEVSGMGAVLEMVVDGRIGAVDDALLLELVMVELDDGYCRRAVRLVCYLERCYF
jgi:hypothetical protein